MQVKFCKDCTYSFPDKNSPWNLRCQHPQINSKDPWALAQTEFTGSECRLERDKTGWFAACGQRGRLWEPK